MYRFSYKGFSPRWVFQKAANHWLTQLMGLAPKGTACQAKAIRTQTGFRFEVELRTPFGSFKAKTEVDEKGAERTEGDWQVNALNQNGERVILDFQQFLNQKKGPDTKAS